MPFVNGEILIWARTTAGLSITDASGKLQILGAHGKTPEERLIVYENNQEEPSRALLVKMANVYRRPLLVFYLDSPPLKGARGTDFRKLPSDYSNFDDAKVDALIRDIYVRHEIVKSAIEDEDDFEPNKLINSIKRQKVPDEIARIIGEKIKFNLDDYQKKSNPHEAFKYFRKLVEEAGIFVLLLRDLGSYHTTFAVEEFRGFSISDNVAPFIVINSNDSKSAMSFTLGHELTHLFLGLTGISNAYFDSPAEKLCNEVSSEIILPSFELRNLPNLFHKTNEYLLHLISDFARAKNVSSTMVAYKLYRLDMINEDTWLFLQNEYRELWIENKEKEKVKRKDSQSGPSYYINKQFSLGLHLISRVDQLRQDGFLSTSNAGKILGVNPKNIQKLTNSTAFSNLDFKGEV